MDKPIHRMRQTKIVATLGPATSTYEQINQLFKAGVDTFRLNLSHGSHADHVQSITTIRQIETETNRPISMIADLQGAKIRIDRFQEGKIMLKSGMHLRFDLVPELGDQRRVQLPHPEVFRVLAPGHKLLLDDGRVLVRVTSCGKDYADTEVISGRQISDHKGVNIPDSIIPISSLTSKDRNDLAFALDHDVDWIALSFIQGPEDLIKVRSLLNGQNVALLSKIEKPSAIEHLEEILDLSDGVMIARGDLGIEMPFEDVPGLQKRIVQLAREKGKPCIVATQMLDSMIRSPTPTRAEVSDVATAVYDGADSVMLSAETAIGTYPLETVSMMNRIIQKIEQDQTYHKLIRAQHPSIQNTTADAITSAACHVADTLGIAAIATYTTSGSTTLRAVRERPRVPILCLTSNLKTARRMALSFGVHAVYTDDVTNFDEMLRKAHHIALMTNIAKQGQCLVITAGVPFGTPGNTNVLRITVIPD